METHLERLCRKDAVLDKLATELEFAIGNGTGKDIEVAFNVIAFVRNSALNAAINHFSARCLEHGWRVRRPCENKVSVEAVIQSR